MIGMIHLLPLVGYPKHPGMAKVLARAIKDLHALEHARFDAAIVENEFDHPHQMKVGPEIVAAMTMIVKEIVKKAHMPIGVEVLLNDPKASLAIARVAHAAFIRTDYFVDRMARPEYGGEMAIDPAGLMVYRRKIRARDVLVLTDLQVKYATLLEKGKTIAVSAKQAIAAQSDGLIITGNVSGEAPKTEDLLEAKKIALGKVPVLIGSGFSRGNAVRLLRYADGAIVGTAIKTKGFVDRQKARVLVRIARKYQ